MNASGEARALVDRARRGRDAIRRAFAEFLAVPTGVITAFLLLGVVAYVVDRNTPEWLGPTRRFLEQHVFIDAGTTSDVLGAIAAGIITVTSITVSVLLLAAQQSAAAMSNAVLDQFLRRRQNQLSFGFFIGVALYTLVTLAPVHEESNAVFGAAVAVVLTIAALYVLLLLLYSTVDQMRPAVVLGSITRLTLRARDRQMALVNRTRRRPHHIATNARAEQWVDARESGYVTGIDVDLLERALAQSRSDDEIVLTVSVGSFVSWGDELARIHTGDRAGVAEVESMADAVRAAVHLEVDRDIAADPAYGVEQIHVIGWTSISSAKSNPAPGLFAIHSVRDLLARWVTASGPDAERQRAPDATIGSSDSSRERSRRDVLPIVYHDTTIAGLFDALESFGVAAAESMQHQTLAEVLRTVSVLAPRLTLEHRGRAAALIERLLASLSHHVRTTELDAALGAVASRLREAGQDRVADAVEKARLSRGESRDEQIPPTRADSAPRRGA